MKITPMLGAIAVMLALASPALAQDAAPSAPPEPLPPPAAAPPGPAPPPTFVAAESPRLPELGTKRDFWKFTLGFRVAFVADEGLDRFSSTDAVAQGSVGASRTLFSRDRLAFAAGAAYEGGGRDQGPRGLTGHMDQHRFLATAEGRYHVLPFFYGFVRLSPGATHVRMRVEDPSAPSALAGSRWGFTTDASLGGSFLLGQHGKTDRHVARFWLTPELGYMFTTAMRMRLSPDDRDDPRPVARTDLGSLAMNGPFIRFTADLSF